MQLTAKYYTGSRIILTSILIGLLTSNANALELADKPLIMSGGSNLPKPNVMLLMDNSGSMLSNSITTNGVSQTRLAASKDAANAIINKFSTKMRLGIFQFQGEGKINGVDNYGGELVNACGSSQAELLSGITNLQTKGPNDNSIHTPLAETYHDITRYFRGLDNYTSPIQLPCQQNVVVVITDGQPTDDTPAGEQTDLSQTPEIFATRPFGWTGTDAAAPLFPNWDGDSTNDGSTSDGSTFLLDDLALFAYEIDIVPTASFNGVSGFNTAPNDHQRLVTHTIAFDLNDNEAETMLLDAANNSGGTYVPATSTASLTAALESALNSVLSSAELVSVSSVAVSSGSVSNSAIAYRTQYAHSGSDWTGSITPYDLSSTVAPVAKTAFSIPTTRKPIYSYSGSAQVSFTGDAGILTAITSSLPCTADASCAVGEAAAVRSYLAGSVSNEAANTGTFTFRNRSGLLGDIMNSAPVYVARPNFRYPDSINVDQTNLYSAFKTDKASRPELVVVGSNDGMLHAFSATTGLEVMSYIPRMILPKLHKLTNPLYEHEYFVDGSPTVGDAYFTDTWHTVLASGMNGGAQGVFGLELTDTSNFSSMNPWEFTDATDSNMGYSYSQPAIVLMANNRWAAVFGNGYNSSEDDTASGGVQGAGNAVLYVVYLDSRNASSYEVLNTNVRVTDQGGDNGLSTVSPVDLDGDNKIDVIYAGDVNGDMWKFNVSSATSSHWSEVANISRLFTRCGGEDTACLAEPTQAITTSPEVGRGPMSNSVMVYFGSGMYLQTADPDNKDLQSFYAILDPSVSSIATVIASELQQQSIEQESNTLTITDPDDTTKTKILTLDSPMRVTTNHRVDFGGTEKGWYMDLTFDEELGERVITSPVLRNGRIIFATNYYTSSMTNNPPMSCDASEIQASGTGWIMQLDALHGSRLAYSPYDLDGNGYYNDSVLDLDGDQAAVSGLQFDENIATPTIIADGNSELIITSGSGGTTDSTSGSAGPGANGVQGWVQL